MMRKNDVCWMIIAIMLCSCAEIQNNAAADAQIQLGLAYLEKNDRTTAKEKFLWAVQDAPDYPKAWDGFAYYMERVEDFETAEKYYQYAVKLAPKESASHNNYGVFLCRQQRYQEAMQQFNFALSNKNYIKTSEIYENIQRCRPGIHAGTTSFAHS